MACTTLGAGAKEDWLVPGDESACVGARVRAELEQERKFLLPLYWNGEPIPGDWKRQVQVQAYAGSPLYAASFTPRLRLLEEGVSSVTSKTGVGEVRDETVVEVENDVAKRLFCLFNMALPKERWRCVSEKRYQLTVDFLQGPYEGIVIAEIEWTGEERPQLPAWLDPLLISGEAVEVTGSWSNVDLAAMAWAMPFSTLTQVWEVLASPRIAVIGVEGGPVSGKDHGLDELMEQYGHYCTVLPEAATIFLKGHGDHLPIDNRYYWNAVLQPAVVMTQLMQERAAQMLARRKGSSVILVNRTVLSNAAFIDGGVGSLASLLGCGHQQLAARYDRIIQMEVAPEQVYIQKVGLNNSRCESHAQAVAQEQKLRGVLSQYPNYVWVGNHEDFRVKVGGLVTQIRQVVPDFGREFPT